MLPVVVIALFGELAGLSAAALSDLRRRIVPNAVAALLATNGVVLRVADRADWPSLAGSLAIALGVLLVLGQVARAGLAGGGDAKLIAAVSLAVPVPSVPALLLAIMLSGGLLACLYAAARGIAQHDRSLVGIPCGGPLERLLWIERRRVACGVPMPYALAVLLGCIGFAISETLR